ncbi:alpha/beta fold hydrolase [Paenarthrobacter nicotinovorans]|uniref:alpha/beta fold hydrolase n=1 Tax=Paenarthrobacter nicotinovorans TaxID=29320 RepID=UPI00047BA42A|nr:alpha/beta hydrolase [Paenarthrobacter nicotinovorans]
MEAQSTASPSGNATLRREVVPTRLGPCTVRIQPSLASPGPTSSGRTAELYLHGAAGSWTTFQRLLSTPPEHDRILVDLPGWGDSTVGARLGSASVETMAGAVIEVLNGLGYRGWNLVGHSMGAVIALHIAATQPERTLSVAAVSPTTSGVADSARSPLRGLVTLPWFVGMLMLMRCMALLGNAGTALIRGVAATPLMRLLLSPLFSDPNAVPAHIFRRLGHEARPRAFCAATRAVVAYDFAQWQGISCRVLALRGAADTFTPQSDLDQLAALGPHVRTATLPDCGHFGIAEQPAIVQQLLEELWQR